MIRSFGYSYGAVKAALANVAMHPGGRRVLSPSHLVRWFRPRVGEVLTSALRAVSMGFARDPIVGHEDQSL